MGDTAMRQYAEDLESGALDGNGRFKPDRPSGIQRRRLLRRGGSSRVTLPLLLPAPFCLPHPSKAAASSMLIIHAGKAGIRGRFGVIADTKPHQQWRKGQSSIHRTQFWSGHSDD